MKYMKLFAVAFGALVITSCSDSKDYNTASDVTVEMEKTEITVKEHAGRFNVPVKLTGNPNGTVRVRVKVEGTGNNPALPFEERNGEWSGNYIVTSDVINISSEDKVANIEISTVDDKVVNEDRTFTVTIESADGATIGTPASTLVVIKDNDSVPYERVQGEWQMKYYDFDNREASMNVSLAGYEEGTKQYGNELKLVGALNQYATADGTTAKVYFFDDEATDTRYVEIEIPQTVGVFGENTSMKIWMITAQRESNGGIGMSLNNTVVTGIFSEDYETLTFDEGIGFAWYVADDSFGEQLGGITAATDIVMKRL